MSKNFHATAALQKETNVDIFSYSKEGFRAFARDHKKFALDFTYEEFVRLFGVNIVEELPTDWDELYDLIRAHAKRLIRRLSDRRLSRREQPSSTTRCCGTRRTSTRTAQPQR